MIKSRKRTPWTEAQHEKRIEDILLFKRCVIPRVGLKDIKAVELDKKFLPLIPNDMKADFLLMCPPPSQEVYEKVKGERNKKAKATRAKEKLLKASETDALVVAGTDALVATQTNVSLVQFTAHEVLVTAPDVLTGLLNPVGTKSSKEDHFEGEIGHEEEL